MAVSADRVARMEGRSTRVLVAVTIVIVVVVDALYVAIVVNQDPRPPELFTIPFIACYLLLMVVVLAVSLMHRWSAATRTALRGAMAAAASMRTLRGPMFTPSNLLGAASAVIAVAVLIAGFEVTERIIVCPANGSMAGGGSGFVTGPYYYDCVNGHLNFHSGSCSSDAIDENGNVTHPGC